MEARTFRKALGSVRVAKAVLENSSKKAGVILSSLGPQLGMFFSPTQAIAFNLPWNQFCIMGCIEKTWGGRRY